MVMVPQCSYPGNGIESHWNERLRKKQTSHTTEPGRKEVGRWEGKGERRKGEEGGREGGEGG